MYISTRRERLRTERTALVTRIIEVVVKALALCFIAFCVSLVFINWLSGCGERFPTMDGGYVQGECISPVELFHPKAKE